jgi:hypothetical protein
MDHYLFILDWDDTLLPTRWLHTPPTSYDRILYSELLLAFLTHLSRRGTIVVVTNSRPPWVHESMQHYLPDLKPLLATIPIYYASQARGGKTDVMRYVSEQAAYTHVICVGDQVTDLEAAAHSITTSSLWLCLWHMHPDSPVRTLYAGWKDMDRYVWREEQETQSTTESTHRWFYVSASTQTTVCMGASDVAAEFCEVVDQWRQGLLNITSTAVES